MSVGIETTQRQVAEKMYLSSVEAAEVAEMTPQKIRRLIEAGKLPAVNTSTTGNRPRWSIRRVDLERFLTPVVGRDQ